jgi:hypothetical protein
MPEDNSALCCFLFNIDIAIKIMIVLAALGIIGSIINILGSVQYIGSGVAGILLIAVLGLGQLVSIFCDYKFLMIFYAHYKKGDNHDDADRYRLVDTFKWLAYQVIAMNLSVSIGYLIMGLLSADYTFGDAFNIVLGQLAGIVIGLAFIYWWRLSFQNHVQKNSSGTVNIADPLQAAKELYS